ncbi:MAG TPA: autotransporter-associated beta strand repeat-containing protein, partial [Gemmataceae bacterium]
MSQHRRMIAGVIGLMLATAAGPAAAQTTSNWTGSGAGGTATTWLTTTNWTGGPVGAWPGVTAAANPANGTAGDVAVFPLIAVPSGNIGIDMGAAGGSLTLGAIGLAGTTQSMILSNVSTTFFPATTLRLNTSGATQVGGPSGPTNVLVSNTNTSSTIQIAAFPVTAGVSRMDLLLGSTTNNVYVPNAGAGITINSDIREVNPGSGLTLVGAGNLSLGGVNNTLTGPVVATGNGTFTATSPAAFGTGTVTFNNADDKSAPSSNSANVTFSLPGGPRTVANNFLLSPSAVGSGFATQFGSGGQIITLSGQISGGSAGQKVSFTDTSASANSPLNYFVLTNATNSFAGTVTVGHDVLAVTSDGALGNTANAINLNTNNTSRGGFRFDADSITLQASRAVSVTTNSVVDTNGFNATIAGTVGNVSGQQLIKAGAGALTLSGSANTLDTLVIRDGTVALDYSANSDNKLAATAGVTLVGGGLRMVANPAGSAQTIGSLTVGANQVINTSLTVAAGGSSSVAAVSNGGTGVTLNLGAVTRKVGGTVDFTPPTVGAITTTSANGTAGLLLDGAATVGKTDWAAVSGGNVTAFAGYAVKNDASTFAAGDHVTNSGPYSGTVGASVAVGSLRFGIADAGAIAVHPAATLTINSGAAGGGILLTPAVTAAEQISGGSLTASGGELFIHHYGTGDLTIGSAITGAIGVAKAGPGRLVLTGNNTFTGAVRINGGTLSAASVTTGTNLGTDPASNGLNVVLGGTLQYTGAGSQTLASTRQVYVAGATSAIDVTQPAANLTVAGTVSGGEAATLTKRGPGTLTLSGSNTNFFANVVVAQGTLQAGNSFALGSLGRVFLGDASTGSNNVALLASANNVTPQAGIVVTNRGTGTVTIGSAAFTGNATFGTEINFQRDVILQAGSTGNTVFSGKLGGTGNVVVSNGGGTNTGIVVFQRNGVTSATLASDFAGNVILNPNSTLMLGGSTANFDKSIPDAANIVFNSGSLLRLSPGATALGYESVNALVSQSAGAGTVNVTDSAGNTFRLTVGAGNGGGTFGGVIQNTAGKLQLTKAGTGTQTLTGANTYSGGTVVSGGTLAADTPGPNSATGTGGVAVTAGGTLRGVGAVAGPITLGPGGTLAPGDAANVGMLTTAA